MSGVRQFSPGNCCYPGQLERKPWDTSEKLWLEESNFPFYSTKPLDPTGREIPKVLIPELSPALKLRTALKIRDFSMDFPFFLLLPSRRGTGRDLQGDLYSHHNTSLIPQQENPSGRNSCLSHPGAEFIGSTIHLLADPTPGRAILPANAHQQWGNRGKPEGKPILTLLIPGLSLQSLISSSTAKAPSLGSIPAISEFSPIPHFFPDGLAKIQGDGDPSRKEWVGFFWEIHEFELKIPVGGEGLPHPWKSSEIQGTPGGVFPL